MTKIKIIEDDLSIANELKEILDRAGYLVEVTEDFSNILDQIRKEQPNLILLDINLPRINGEVLLQQIRKESNIPIIMVTSKNTEVDEYYPYHMVQMTTSQSHTIRPFTS